MPNHVSSYVRTKIREVLPSADAEQAIATLEATCFPLAPTGSLLERRIHLAIIKLVCDPWRSRFPEPARSERFRDALDLARTDWRDLLVSAGLEHDNWPQVLAESGYERPEGS